MNHVKRSRLKVALLSAVGCVAAVDLIHAILNRFFDPFTGPWDTAMHCVLAATTPFYFAVCLWGCFRLATYFCTTEFLSKDHHASVILLILIAGEYAFTSHTPVRSGSSQYHPLFPDFLGGMILAVATLATGRDHLRSRVGRIAVVLVVFLWLAGSFTVDTLWWTERTNRGVGPAWRLPLLGSTLAAFSYLFMLLGPLVETCIYPPGVFFKDSPLIQGVWLLTLTIALAWGLKRLTPNRVWLASLALAASVIFLGCKAVEWSAFIAD